MPGTLQALKDKTTSPPNGIAFAKSHITKRRLNYNLALPEIESYSSQESPDQR